MPQTTIQRIWWKVPHQPHWHLYSTTDLWYAYAWPHSQNIQAVINIRFFSIPNQPQINHKLYCLHPQSNQYPFYRTQPMQTLPHSRSILFDEAPCILIWRMHKICPLRHPVPLICNPVVPLLKYFRRLIWQSYLIISLLIYSISNNRTGVDSMAKSSILLSSSMYSAMMAGYERYMQVSHPL